MVEDSVSYVNTSDSQEVRTNMENISFLFKYSCILSLPVLTGHSQLYHRLLCDILLVRRNYIFNAVLIFSILIFHNFGLSIFIICAVQSHSPSREDGRG